MFSTSVAASIVTASLRSMTPVLHFFHPPPLPWYPPPPSPPPPARGGEILEASVMSTVNPLKSRRRQSGRRLPVHGRPSVAGSSRRVTSEAVPLAGFFWKAISSVVLHSVVFPQPFISQKISFSSRALKRQTIPHSDCFRPSAGVPSKRFPFAISICHLARTSATTATRRLSHAGRP